MRRPQFDRGELALGNLQQTDAEFEAPQGLPRLTAALDDEVLGLIARQGLAGRGIGYVDAHLITSVLLTPGCWLWTKDQRLQQVTKDLDRDAAFGVHWPVPNSKPQASVSGSAPSKISETRWSGDV